jgi:UDP-N-acetylglucosamine:LPS N-acetylglucosamine transferase
MDQPSPGRRVLVVTASMGSGHTHAALELAGRLEAKGHVAEVVDVLELPQRGEGAALRAFYRLLLRRAPLAYDAAMRAWAARPGFFERVTAAGAGPFERGLRARIISWRPDVVVSTFDLAAQALGRMRGRGEVAVPVVTFVTDPGVHPYWVSPHVETHLAVTEQAAAALRRLGARGATAAGPLVAGGYRRPPDRGKARADWGLPQDGCIALVSAGSWGVGNVEQAVADLASTGDVLPVVLCGRNQALLRRLRRRGAGRAVEWTDDVAGLMAAADVLVDNAGGLTCLQALVAGLPVVLHRPIPGHGRFNAAALAGAGLGKPAGHRRELLAAVGELARPGPAREAAISRGRAIVTGDPADHVLRAVRAAR